MKQYLLVAIIALLSFTAIAGKGKPEKKSIEQLVTEQVEQMAIQQKTDLEEINNATIVQMGIQQEQYLDSVNLYIKLQLIPHKITIDSLRKNIEKQEQREEFLNSALSEQTGIFSIIVAVLLAIIGYITLDKIKNEIENAKTENEDKLEEVTTKYKESISNYDSIKKDFKLFKSDIYKSNSTLFGITGITLYVLKYKHPAFLLHIKKTIMLCLDYNEGKIEKINDSLNGLLLWLKAFQAKDYRAMLNSKDPITEYFDDLQAIMPKDCLELFFSVKAEYEKVLSEQKKIASKK